MKRVAAILLSCALAGGALLAAATAASGRPGSICRPGAGRGVLADTHAQVYVARVFSTISKEEERVYLACAYGRRHTYELGDAGMAPATPSGDSGTVVLALSGDVVAYEQWSVEETQGIGPYVGRDLIFVLDLRTGRVLHKLPTGTPNPPNPSEVGVGGAGSLVLKPDGAVAWIVDTVAREGRHQVHAVDSTGSRELASGPGIDSESLALAGSTLYWTDEGKPETAVLH
jgi:hypothetical protein